MFGATGVIGEYIVNAIIDAKSSFDRIVVFTSPGTAEKKAHEVEKLKGLGVDFFIGDVQNEEDIKEAYKGGCLV